jgi:phosphoglycerate dehydrogenase-like enzyme
MRAMGPPRPRVLVYQPFGDRAHRTRQIVLDAYPHLDVAAATTPAEAAPHLGTVEVICGWGLPSELLRHARALRWLHKLGAGVDDIVFSGALPESAVLTRSGGEHYATRMAEYALGYILAFSLRMRRWYHLQQQARWQPSQTAIATGKTVGIAGTGSIGREIARKAAAIGMTVVGWRSRPEPVPGFVRTYGGLEQLPDFLSTCDFLVIALPLTPRTAGVFDRKALDALRPDAHVINVSRGAILDEGALVEALREGRLAGAALDVFVEEPLPSAHPLWSMDNAFVTPHVSGVPDADAVALEFVRSLGIYLDGGELPNRVRLTDGY